MYAQSVLLYVLISLSSFVYLKLKQVHNSRAVARKKLQPRRTHGPLYEISRMKSSNIISLIKKNKNRQYLVKFYRGECLGSPHTGYGGE